MGLIKMALKELNYILLQNIVYVLAVYHIKEWGYSFWLVLFVLMIILFIWDIGDLINDALKRRKNGRK